MTKVCSKHPELNGARQKHGYCVGCAAEASKRYRQSVKGKKTRASVQRKYNLSDKGKDTKKKSLNNTPKEVILNRRKKAKNTEKGKLRRLIEVKLRKKDVKLATPKWANITAIMKIYALRPDGYHVDHIVPLKGIDPVTKQHVVCGLNVENNLGYLPSNENQTKWAWFSLD